MEIIVTAKSFDEMEGRLDYLLPALPHTMLNLIEQLRTMEEPHINISELRAVHITNDYKKELFAFQEKHGHMHFVTENSLGRGAAQVINVSDANEDTGFHIFMDKIIPFIILACQFFEDHADKINPELLQQLRSEKKDYIRLIRHELAHVEDETNQKGMSWLKRDCNKKGVDTLLRDEALRLWEEFYACQRAAYFFDDNSISHEVKSLMDCFNKAEEEICKMRWEYNIRKLELNIFVQKFHDYIITTLIQSCYFMGHMNKTYEYIADELQTIAYPSRFFPHIMPLWSALRKMNDEYPSWQNTHIFDEVTNLIQETIEEFEIYMSDSDESIYYSIPPKRLKPKMAVEENGI